MTRTRGADRTSLPTPTPTSAALVTGASSGLGVELARSLAARGHNVVLVARRAERLAVLAEELARAHGVRAEALECDLRDRDARARLVDNVAVTDLTVEILVNNAGYGSAGPFVALAPETDMVRLNCEAVVELCGVYAPAMVDRRRGAILNVASVASFQPLVRQATYSATKAMVRTFTEALHVELRPMGVAVTVLCPGGMRTEFIDVAEVGDVAATIPDFMFEALPDVAEAGIGGLERNRRVVIPGLVNRVGAVAGKHTPHSVLLRALDRFSPFGHCEAGWV